MTAWTLTLLGLIAYAFAFQGSRGLYEPDEGRYTDVASQMLRTGNWMTPHLNDDLPHFTKPPLTYWAIAVSLKAFGRNTWAARTPWALAFVATVLLIHQLGRILAPQRPRLAMVIYASSVLPYAASNIVTPDTLLTLWETLAAFCFVMGWFGPRDRLSRVWIVGMWASFGLAFLTKGPPGALPLLAIVVFAGLMEGGRGLRRVASPWGAALFVAIGLSWYVAVVAIKPELLRYYLDEELYQRLVRGRRLHNSQWYGAFKVYVPALLAGTLPWTWQTLQGLGALLKSLPRGIGLRSVRSQPEKSFLLLWLAIPLGIFFAARSRLPLYVVPLLAPLSLLLARRLQDRWNLTPRAGILLAGWALLALSVKWAAAVFPYDRDIRPVAQAIHAGAPGLAEEVVFVDRKPLYGLGLYCTAEVEEVTLKPRGPSEGPPSQEDETVGEEIAEKEPHQLFVVRGDDIAEFKRQVQRAEAAAQARGNYGDYWFFSVQLTGTGQNVTGPKQTAEAF